MARIQGMKRVGGKRLWECDVCESVSVWTSEHSYYGSILVQENCGHIVVSCCASCRAGVDPIIADFDEHHHAKKCTWERD